MQEAKPILKLTSRSILDRLSFSIAFLFCVILGYTQDCSITLSGTITDVNTGKPIESVFIDLEEEHKPAITNAKGQFTIKSICPGKYHLLITHIGCEPQNIPLTLSKDTNLSLSLEHTSEHLHNVLVLGKYQRQNTPPTNTLLNMDLEATASKSLAEILSKQSGVYMIKNGNHISKPMIHGQFGNRISILNNGVTLSGQQWGNDHSPEIDPLSANRIEVIKGTAALAYIGSNLGGVILIEPGSIKEEPHLHGKFGLFYGSNGNSIGTHLQVKKYTPLLSYQINGSLKTRGDAHTPDYYLTNTGSREGNLAIQLEKKWNELWKSNLYLSTFNTSLGILRGSHVGNLTDLENAWEREVPLYTDSVFSYTINPPSQQVSHQLVKLKTTKEIAKDEGLEFVVAKQLNNRKEFDVRRSGRSEIPALSLQQKNLFSEVIYYSALSKIWSQKWGGQFSLTDNSNNPETNILPLIPDFVSNKWGAFSLFTRKKENILAELGIRYDGVQQNVAAISQSVPREIIRYQNIYHNFRSSAGLKIRIGNRFKMSGNVGIASRNPAINELYSNGLHQGVSGYEIGHTQLNSEYSIKNVLDLKYKINSAWTTTITAYSQWVQDYIYLQPTSEIIYTIRGAFPVFRYQQTNANISGIDLNSQYNIGKQYFAQVQGSVLRGQDLSSNSPLVYMPANRFSIQAGYNSVEELEIGKSDIENVIISIRSETVLEQKRLLSSQDFVAPPPGYSLLSAKLEGTLHTKKLRLRMLVQAENILNIAYRDYLNRLRYFADDQGRNITFTTYIYF